MCQLETFDAKAAHAMPAPANQPLLNVPTVVLSVVSGLIAIHMLFWALGESWQVWSLYALSFIPARLGPEPVAAPMGANVWSFFTYALLHADIYHLASNSIWLAIFSTPLARRIGAIRYLVLLSVSAVAGAAAMLPLNWGEFLIVVGASASVSATLAAVIPIMFAPGFKFSETDQASYAVLEVVRPSDLFRHSGAIAFSLVFLALTLFTGASMAMTGTAFLEERNIAWEAHLGGFVTGLILFYLLDKKRVT
jgi:membrane associated rhomboid family serine protease